MNLHSMPSRRPLCAAAGLTAVLLAQHAAGAYHYVNKTNTTPSSPFSPG